MLLAVAATATILFTWRRRCRFVGQLSCGFVALWATSTAVIERWGDETALAEAPHLLEVAAGSPAVSALVLAVLTCRHWYERAPLV